MGTNKNIMPLSLSPESIKKMEEIISSSIQQSMAENFHSAIAEAAGKMANIAVQGMVSQLEKFRPVMTISFEGFDDTNDTKETSKKEAQSLAKSVATGHTSSEKTPMINIDAVCKSICDAINMVKSGYDLKVTSDIMAEEVRGYSNNRIQVYLARFGRFQILMPNFRLTKEVAALYKHNWPGWVSADKVKEVLVAAFCNSELTDPSDVSTSPLKGTRAPGERPSGYKQGSYVRIKPGSMMMRMRCHKDSTELAPMVIDSRFARKMYDAGYTVVKIGAEDREMTAKMKNEVVELNKSKSINLIFKKEAERTRAPRRSDRVSRLHPYGKSGKNRKRNSTFCINGDAFQRTILNWFHETCDGQKECFFRLVKNGNESEHGISYRIVKA